jgi:hypothetical protein
MDMYGDDDGGETSAVLWQEERERVTPFSTKAHLVTPEEIESLAATFSDLCTSDKNYTVPDKKIVVFIVGILGEVVYTGPCDIRVSLNGSSIQVDLQNPVHDERYKMVLSIRDQDKKFESFAILKDDGIVMYESNHHDDILEQVRILDMGYLNTTKFKSVVGDYVGGIFWPELSAALCEKSFQDKMNDFDQSVKAKNTIKIALCRRMLGNCVEINELRRKLFDHVDLFITS